MARNTPPTPPPAPMPYLTPKQAAEIAGVTEQTITGHCRGKYLPRLPALQVGGRWMILPRDLDWWMQLGRGPGRPPTDRPPTDRPTKSD
jgi:hypothetical protein